MAGVDAFEGLSSSLENGLVDKVGFTGSTDVGRSIGELCGRYLQTPCLELGGKNPMVVMPDADLDLAVEGALFSGFGTAGQRCTSLGTVWVHESLADAFVERFVHAVEGATIGDPRRDVLYGPMIDERFMSRFEKWLGLVESHHSVRGSSGVGQITAGNPRSGFVGDPDAGLFAHPTVAIGVKGADVLALTETFGPLVGVGTFGNLDEAIELSNAPGYGLSSSIYTTDPQSVWRFRAGVGAGMISVNNSTSGAEAHLPFGGNGKSGNGSRQSGVWVLDQFTRWQSMNWDYSGQLQKAQMDVVDLPSDQGFRLSNG
jgi:aldehyde dehydrogenase (NAD+)